MDIQVSIPDEASQHLSPQAQEEFTTSIKAFARELLNEASRLEAADRGSSGSPEITRATVKDASMLLRKNRLVNSSSRSQKTLYLFSSLSTFIAGFLFDLNSFRDPETQWTLIVFLLVLAVAITSTTAHVLIGRSR